MRHHIMCVVSEQPILYFQTNAGGVRSPASAGSDDTGLSSSASVVSCRAYDIAETSSMKLSHGARSYRLTTTPLQPGSALSHLGER